MPTAEMLLLLGGDRHQKERAEQSCMAGFNSGKEQLNEIRLIGPLRNGGKTVDFS